MRHSPCPSYDVPSREELRREEMDEARDEARQEGYDEGHEAGHEAGWREAMEAITVALREAIDECEATDDDVTIRDVCRTVLVRLDASYSDVPDPSVIDEETMT